jgi:hypothetical protein
MRSIAAAGALLLGLAAGCAAVIPVQAAPDANTPGLPTALRDAVRADAAQRAGVAPAAVRIAAADAVTWRDGSLGCPRPDLAYTQALIPGWRLFVDAGGRTLRYHANTSGTRWLHCVAAQAQEPLSGDITR